MTRMSLAAPFLLSVLAGVTLGAPPRVIYSTIPGHPSARCPGTDTGTGGHDFTALLSLHTSFDGNWWIFKGFIDDPENDVIVYGFGTDGANGSLAAWEAMPTGLADATTHNFLDSDCGINDRGDYVFGSRLDGATPGTDEIILASDGAGGVFAAFREGDAAPGLFDPSGSGDEVFGNSLNSPTRLNDATVNCRADLIRNVDAANESALYIGAAPVAQEGTLGADGQTYAGFAALTGNTLDTSADGSTWIIEADIDPSPITAVEAVVVNGAVQLKTGDSPGEGTINNVFSVRMAANGSWIARGDDDDNNDWVAIQTGAGVAIIAETHAPITPGAAEFWHNAITGTNLNDAGDYVISGNTTSPDPAADTVMVVNSETVVAREGDPVDVDANGLADDDAEIASFSPNDLAFNPAGDVIAFVTLRSTSTGAPLGDAFVVISASAPCTPADIDDDGDTDIDDIELFVQAFLATTPSADIDGDGDTDVDDIEFFVDAFIVGC